MKAYSRRICNTYIGVILVLLCLFQSQNTLAQSHSAITPKIKFGIGQQGMLYYVKGSCIPTFPDYISYDTVVFTLWKHKSEFSLLISNDFGRLGLAFQHQWFTLGDYDAFTFDMGLNLLSVSRRLRKDYFFGPGIANTNLAPYDGIGLQPCIFLGGKNFEARFECIIRNTRNTALFTHTWLTSDMTIQNEQIYTFTLRYYFPINFKRKSNKTVNP